MQDIVFYAVANETLGVVRDYANAKNKTAPVLALGVAVRLRMRLFAGPDTATPYPVESFNSIAEWQWSMDGDFDRTTACKLVADANGISVQTVTDTINGETMNFTEFVIPISNMNTQELAAWLGNEKMRSGLTGELVGYDGDGHAVFVLQIEKFTVRNRVAGLGDPTALDQEVVTRTQAETMIRAAVSSSAASKQDKLTPGTGISVTSAGVISVSDVPQSAVTGLSASLAGKQAALTAGDLVELSGATVNRKRYMAVRQLADMATVSKKPAGSTVNQTYRIIAPGNAYKLTAVSTDLYLATEAAFASGGSMQWGIESHLELFVARTGRVHTDSNVILADALEPDAVNNCTVRFHNGRAIISVEDHFAGSIVTLNSSAASAGTLRYYLQQVPAADATYNETQYIAVDASLNGQTLDLGGAVTSGEKHVVGNGYGETVVSGDVSCTSKTTFSNLGMNGVCIVGGTMTLGDVCIPNGGTVSVSGGGLAIEKVSGDGGTIDLGGTVVIIPRGQSASAFGITVTGANGAVGGAVVNAGSGTLVKLESCVFSGNSAQYGAGFANIHDSSVFNVSDCTIANNPASFRGGGIYTSRGAETNLVSCVISGNSKGDICNEGSATTNLAGCTVGTVIANAGTVTFGGSNTIDSAYGTSGSVFISSGASITLRSSIVPGGGIVIPASAIVTIAGSGGSSGYFSDLALTGATITNLGLIYGATVTVPASGGPWLASTTGGDVSLEPNGTVRQVVISGGVSYIGGL